MNLLHISSSQGACLETKLLIKLSKYDNTRELNSNQNIESKLEHNKILHLISFLGVQFYRKIILCKSNMFPQGSYMGEMSLGQLERPPKNPSANIGEWEWQFEKYIDPPTPTSKYRRDIGTNRQNNFTNNES